MLLLNYCVNGHFMVNSTTLQQEETTSSILIVITNIPELVNISDVFFPAEADIFTDHSKVNFDLLVHHKRLPVYDYRREDFTTLRSALDSFDLSRLITTNADINDDW